MALNIVVGHQTKHIVSEGVQQHWYMVRCDPGCRQDGPWRIFGPGKEKFHCVKCGKTMAVDRIFP